MKKNILLFCALLVVFSLVAYGFMDGNDSETDQVEIAVSDEVAINTPAPEKVKKKNFSDFIYDIAPRFNAIKKTDLDKVSAFNDLIGEEHTQRILSYSSLSVVILDGDKKTETKETGKSGILTPAQIELLRSVEYSTNLVIMAEYMEKWPKTGLIENSRWGPYLTVVPEKQATYSNGKEALMEYLRESSKESRFNVVPEKLQPAKLYFTVTKNGTIEKVYLDRTSNYPSVDKTMIELISKAPGEWEAAENSKGEKVDQVLVVSFGLMGC